jgi:acyl carrier protein
MDGATLDRPIRDVRAAVLRTYWQRVNGNSNHSDFHYGVQHNDQGGFTIMRTGRDDGLLRGLITRLTGRDVRALRPGDSLRRVLGIDGLDLVRVLIAAEELYGVIVRDEQIDRIRTYGDLLRTLGIGEADCEPCRPV